LNMNFHRQDAKSARMRNPEMLFYFLATLASWRFEQL
jgi:hypothetical protein